MAPRFLTEFDPDYGQAVVVADGIERVVADNPNMFTAWGTGTYIVGDRDVAVIDPGPDLESHVDALLAALRGRRVTHVLVTHTHADHSPATAALVRATGARTYGFGPHPVGPAEQGDRTPGGEGVVGGDHAAAGGIDPDLLRETGDGDFVPDVVVADGDVIVGAGFRFECLHTPGHISNHVCYAERERDVLFPGDHVMGWSTTVVSPPDGDMADYVANLRRLLQRSSDGVDSTYLPTHGPPITDPGPYVAELLEHRLERDRQIMGLLDDGDRTVEELVEVMYADVPMELHLPAARSVLAHLIALQRSGRVAPDAPGAHDAAGRWSASPL